MRRSWIALFLLAGCGNGLPVAVSELGVAARPVPVDLEVTGLGNVAQAPDPGFSVVATPGGIVVTGGYSTSGGGYELRAEAWEESSVVRLELSIVSTSAGFTVPLGFEYEAAVRDITPGSYQFQLVWRAEDSRALVHQQKVRVP